MSLEIKIFAILVFLCAVVICIAIRNASKRISESIDNMTIDVQFISDEEEEEEDKEKRKNEKH
jgi:hypothetical protein